MRNAMIIEPGDSVIVAIEPIAAGETAVWTEGGERSLTVLSDIPIYHKIACRPVKKGEPVVKYGQHIGVAARDIEAGEHVHLHNVESRRESLREKEARA